MLVHSVFFYLRSDLTEAQREEFVREGLQPLSTIPEMKAFYLGSPASVTARPVVDLSFSYSICCVFENLAGHDAYQIHPLHKGFVERFKSYWTKVQIYDAA